MKYHPLIILICILLLTPAAAALADAIVVTRAMRASTIAEIFIEEKSIRVELEIGVQDLAAFPNLLPDELYTRLGNAPVPFEQRLRQFLSDDFKIVADGDQQLAGHLVGMKPGDRIVRDEITGEPLPSGDDPELVVRVTIGYAMPWRPKTLTLHAPAHPKSGALAASVGFVTYHEGLPLNDFRYLGRAETLDLDWKDPWYSQFRNRNLRRQFNAPMSAFLYVENFEVRKEIIVRPKDLQQWIDLGLSERDTVYAGEQQTVRDMAAAYFLDRNPVTIDGRPASATLDRVHFVRRSLRRTGIVDPPEDLALVSATLGIIYVYPVDSLPDKVTMTWETFDDRIQRVPASATDEAGGLPYVLQPNDSVLVWENFLTNPTLPTLAAIEPPRGGSLSVYSVGAVAVALIFLAVRWRRRREWLTWVVVSVLIVAALAVLPLQLSGGMSQERTEAVVGGLLTNVYRAFDYRDESAIYDALARSASGDLLTQIYLETRRSLELQNQGGARVKVKEVTLEAVSAEDADGGFEAECTWTVSGSVGHWGHLHTRTNQYQASLTIKALDGAWKITALELIEEQRVSLQRATRTNDINIKS